MYCVEFSNKLTPYYGFIKPWNAVRDVETYSLTYLPPSFIRGIKYELGIKGDIIRHKLLFSKSHMQKDFTKAVVYLKNGQRSVTNHHRHTLVNPKLILGFETKEDADLAIGLPIYMGQNIYPLYGNASVGVFEITTEEFDKLQGVETFETTESDENGLYVGNDRRNNNKRMYIQIVRNEWDDDQI